MTQSQIHDIAIIGGGVNGCAVARDAAGRGLSVFLCEAGDLAQGTSSASTKLFHGGLRYLEYYEFRLVRHALIEREILLTMMPHIARPLRFVLPYHKGLRPAWMLRLGLFIYDHLGGRRILPPTKTLDLTRDEAGKPLRGEFRKGFEYSDCWVDDSRLVVLLARDAANRGAQIATRTRGIGARRKDGLWQVTLQDSETGARREITARALVNAGGPWVGQIIDDALHVTSKDRVRLVRGSHVVVPRIFDHDRAYIFQNADGRIIFAIPFERDFTLIGTTDIDHEGGLDQVSCTEEEAEYLCNAASEYFRQPVARKDVVWTYSGVRPLYDDGASSATEATRDYVLKREGAEGEAPLINIFGGKITTHRFLATQVMKKLERDFAGMRGDWTAGAPLPGGDFRLEDRAKLVAALRGEFEFIDQSWAERLVAAYGTLARKMLGDARSKQDMGRDFGATLHAREVRWLMLNEWARTAEDVLWRRSKLGLRLDDNQVRELETWMKQQAGNQPAKTENAAGNKTGTTPGQLEPSLSKTEEDQ